VIRERVSQCLGCGRATDLAEKVRCGICEQFLCQSDCVAGACRSCARLLTATGGRPLTDAEIRVLRETHSWIRRGSILESSGLLHVYVRSARLSLRRNSKLLVFDRSVSISSSVALRGSATERHITAPLTARARLAFTKMEQLT
jgi:hypothetical protein